MLELARQVVDGTWKPGIARSGISNGGVYFYPFGKSVPASVRTRVNKVATEVAKGKVKIFQGPITDNQGKVVVPAGQSISSQTALHDCCTWLATGIEGKAPSGS
jgi:basic membrane protein A and related proteins